MHIERDFSLQRPFGNELVFKNPGNGVSRYCVTRFSMVFSFGREHARHPRRRFGTQTYNDDAGPDLLYRSKTYGPE